MSVKAKRPIAASVPEYKTWSNCVYLSTSTSQHWDVNHNKMCPGQTAKGMRKVQGSFWVSQGDSSLPTVLQSYENVLARNYKAARLRTWGQSLRVSIRPLWQAASILLITLHANQRLVIIHAECEHLTTNMEAVHGVSQPVQGHKSNPAC